MVDRISGGRCVCRPVLLIGIFLFGLAASLAAVYPPVASSPDRQLAADFGKLPFSFEPNAGQTDSQVKFISRGQGYTLFLTDKEAVLSLSNSTASGRPAVIRMRLLGGSRPASVTGIEPLPGQSNYFTGNNAARWRTRVPRFGRVVYHNVYPGTDLIYYGNQGRLEYDFVLAPNADPRAIRFTHEGAARVAADSNGDLVLTAAGGGQLRLHAPVIYQQTDGQRRQVAGRYLVSRRGDIRFQVGNYDRNSCLLIRCFPTRHTWEAAAVMPARGLPWTLPATLTSSEPPIHWIFR